ncbi:MAG TPA: hypothetical protein DF783_05570 [Acidimicrobiaceae bacterium]|nr:hypothetical protein [Acidimicrobiaceae bacterium]
MPMERLLASTAIEESWGESEPVLFLGEWCRIYSRRHKWEALDAVVAPYHWADRTKVDGDRVYLWELHERLLVDLAARFNEIHGVEHGIQYWRILVGPWLGYFTQALFDRWEQIQSAISSFDVSETVVLRGLVDARCASDMDDYLGLGNSWQWNHHLSAEILTGFTDVGVRSIDIGGSGPALTPEDGDPALTPLHRAAIWGSSVLRLFSKASDVVVTNACLRSAKTEMLLQWRLGQSPVLTPVEPVDRCLFNASKRKWVLDPGESRHAGFDECLRSLIPRFIPVSYLEGYRSLVAQAEDLPWPSRPGAIFTSASHFFDDVFKAWCAERVERGSPLVVGQHGGHVGVGWSFNHDHQLAIADTFLSWGWSDPEEPKVRPLGMMKDPVLDENSESPGSRVVLVMGNETPQVASLSSSALSSQFLDYVGAQIHFIEALDWRARDALLVRLSRYDLDWCLGKRLADRLPDVELDDGCRPVLDLLGEARLYVATNNGTTFLESIFLDVPTVMFWDTDMWGLTHLAKPAFERLSRAGVFFDDPIRAAGHVSEVWEDASSWWADPDVREAVEAFSIQFCRRSPDIVGDVRQELVEVRGRP